MQHNEHEQDFVPLRASLVAALDELRAEQPTLLGKHCHAVIRQALLRAPSLPPDPATFQRWLRAACRRADGAATGGEYSHSQRALFVQQFNAVGQHWASGGLVDAPLQVSNYRRRRPGGVADPRVCQALRPSDLRCLRETFLLYLGQSEKRHTPEEAQWQAFCRLIFVLTMWGGLAGPGALAMLARMTWGDLRTALDGFIRIPRWGIQYRLYLPPIAQAFALAVGVHLPRKRTFDEPEAKQPILPIEPPGDDPHIEQRRLQMAHRRFDDWLHALCRKAGVRPVGLRTLQQAARLELAKMYGNVLAGAILGLTPYAPVPDEQLGILESYLAPFALPQPPTSPLPAPQRPTPSRLVRGPKRVPSAVEGSRAEGPAPPSSRPEPTEPKAYDGRLETTIGRLQDTLRPLVAGETTSRVETAAALDGLACELLGIASQVNPLPSISPAHEQGPGSELPTAFAAARERVDGDAFNVAALAAWLAHLCRATRLTPLTLANYRSAGSTLARHLAGVRWDEMDEEDVREVAALDLGVSTRSRLLAVMGQVVEFLQEEMGMDVAGLNRGTVRLARRLRPVNLPSMEHVEQMLAQLLAWRQRAMAQKLPAKARLAYDAFLAILLATFFGLRRREIAHLRLGDVMLDAQTPYLRVWRSKRGKSRVVWTRHVSPEVLDLLRAWWQRRWEAVGGDPAALFLGSDETLTPTLSQKVREQETLIEGLGKAVNAAIRVLEIKQDLGALPTTFHTLRHVYANRLLVLGVPPIEIARSLGHTSTDTTTGSHLHAFDWLQCRRLEEWLAAQPQSGATATQIGALLGVRRPAVLAVLKKLPLGEYEDWYEESRHLYPWAMGVRLLASRLQMDSKQPGNQVSQPEPSPADLSGRVLAAYYRVFRQNH